MGYQPCKDANPGNFCPMKRPTSWCQDTDFDKGDKSGDHCSKYYANKGWCGRFDTASFASRGMCCACGGGISAKFNNAHNCNCDWIHLEEACAGTGGECSQPCKAANPGNFCPMKRPTSWCQDTDFDQGDKSGDHCSKYYTNKGWCGRFDT